VHAATGFKSIVAFKELFALEQLPQFFKLDDFLTDRRAQFVAFIKREVTLSGIEKFVDVSIAQLAAGGTNLLHDLTDIHSLRLRL
jgi:hypothetical protein